MKLISLLCLSVLFISCASKNESHSKINSLEVSEKLTKNVTTQSQVLETFGTPDVVEKTPHGDMWGYNRQSSESESSGVAAVHYISSTAFWNWTGIGASSDSSSSSTKTASLTIFFNKNKVLETYSFRTERF